MRANKKKQKIFAKRLALSKSLGLLLGLIIFFSSSFMPGEIRWGLLLMFTLLGGMVGLMGVMTHHPVWTNWRLRWWMRGTMMGAFLGLITVLLAQGAITEMLGYYQLGGLNPYWGILEWAIWGAVIDGVATKFAGEGQELQVL